MKVSAVLIWFCLVALFVGACIWQWYMGYQARQVTAYIQLADDASDPQVKADYLKKFLEKVRTKNLPEYAAFFFPTERLSVAQQEKVTESLIKRCEETAQLPRESFGFAQGMTQLTGQEFDHTLKEITSIYNKALKMSYGFFLYYFLSGAFIFNLIVGIFNLFFTSYAFDNY